MKNYDKIYLQLKQGVLITNTSIWFNKNNVWDPYNSYDFDEEQTTIIILKEIFKDQNRICFYVFDCLKNSKRIAQFFFDEIKNLKLSNVQFLDLR